MTRHFRPRVDPWQIDDSEFYELESYDDQMRFLLRYAVLAPSGHNTQPWAFRITRDRVEVFADYSRRLLTVDPGDRELLMSVGAAITNFRVAGAHFGIETTVSYESGPEERIPVALISVCETCAPNRQLGSLFGAIRKRHTNRTVFNSEPIEPQALSRVCDIIDRFPETLQIISSHQKKRACEMIEEAERAQMARPAFRAEIADWIRPDDDDHTDGLRVGALGVPRLLAAGASWFLRQFDAGAWQGPHDRRLAESAATLLLVTSQDDRVSLIRAGETLELLLLTIADVGLQYSFLNQPIEVEIMREHVAALAGPALPPQLLIRIGMAGPVDQAMPRRPLEQVVAPRES